MTVNLNGRPTVPEVLPLVHALYATAHGAVGCCLHVVLDDANCDDGNAQHCLERARLLGHYDCIVLAEQIVRMTRTQRRVLAARAYDGKAR